MLKCYAPVTALINDVLMITVICLLLRMSERYTRIGSKGALLVVVLVISVWEMTAPMEATIGECITAKLTCEMKCLSKLSVPTEQQNVSLYTHYRQSFHQVISCFFFRTGSHIISESEP